MRKDKLTFSLYPTQWLVSRVSVRPDLLPLDTL